MQPTDYTINIQTPLEAQAQGFQLGAAEQQAQAQAQAKQQALVQQQQMQTDLAALASKQNPTGQDYAAVMTRYPQLAEHFKKSWDVLNGAQQQTQLDQTSQVYAAVQSGQPQVASKLLRDQAAAQRNSGQEQQAKAAETMAQWVDLHPESARTTVGLALAAKLGPAQFATAFGTLGDQSRKEAAAPLELQKTGAEIANIGSQIEERSKRLGLDQDKLTSEYQFKFAELKQKAGELPEYVSKDLSAAAMDAITAQQSASRMNDLAAQIDAKAKELGSGGTAKAGELWKNTFGSQNELTRIRSEFSRIVTPAAMAAYKKVATGSTSDKDIDTAMVGVPKDTDNPERMASFLRGAAKLQQYDNVLNNAKAEWLGAVRNLGKAQQDINVDGVQVPAGTTFKQFTDQYVDQKVKALTGQAEATAKAQQVQGRSYMRFAQPGAQ